MLVRIESPLSEFDKVVLVDDRLELGVLAGVGLRVEDGLGGVAGPLVGLLAPAATAPPAEG